jgi:hypothetical protein
LAGRLAEEDMPPKTLGEMWGERNRLFSHLQFRPEVEGHLELLEPVAHLQGVLSSLRSYNSYAADWSDSRAEFDHHRMLHVTPESSGRLKMYGEQMTFDWNGQSRTFSLHGRFTPGAGRIHMWPDISCGTIVIGYIGMKIGL